MNKRKWFHLFLTLAVMVVIFVQSALPASLSAEESGLLVAVLSRLFPANPELISFWVRKTAHFLEYLVLGGSITLTLNDYMKRGIAIPFLAWAAGAVYAVSDEVHQSFVPGRSCELRDMLIDACGVAVGVLLVYLALGRKKR